MAELHRVKGIAQIIFSAALTLICAPQQYVLILAFVLFFAPIKQLHAQVYDPVLRDSLIKIVQQYDAGKKELQQPEYVPADTQKADLLWQIISADDMNNNLNEFKHRLEELKIISNKLNYKKGIANALTCEASYKISQQEYKKALELHKKALEIRQQIGDSVGIRWSYLNIGNCFIFQNIYKEAMPWFIKSLKLSEAANDSSLLYYNYMCMFGIYDGIGNKKESLACMQKAVDYAYNPKSQYNYGMALMLLAYNYASAQNQPHKADSLLTIAYKIIVELKSVFHYNYYYNVKASVNEARGNYGNAILLYKQSTAMEDSLKISQNKPYNLRSIVENILRADNKQLAVAGIAPNKKYDEVINYANQSLAITIPSNIMDMTADNYKFISQAYEAKGNMKQAYKYFKMSTQIKDSLFSSENTKAINELRMKYETEKKEAEIVLLKKDNLLQQQEVGNQKTQRNAFIGGLVMVMMISGVVYNKYKTKQASNRQLAVNLQRLKHTQQQLIEQEKLASVGALTAGIAHEIKNPLNFINNFSELNTEIVEDLPTAKDDAEKNKMLGYLKSNFGKITAHGERADSIVRNMLAHSNNELRDKELTDINELCNEYLRISYRSVLVSNPLFKCELKTSLDPAIPKITIMAQDFSRALINIFSNAFYAVNQHKSINQNLKPQVSLTTQFQNNLITILIKDNGTGMSNEIREKMFEPFYTTKPAGQGTGLGLSLSFDIIKDHNGKIEVESKENEFTQFKIILPTSSTLA